MHIEWLRALIQPMNIQLFDMVKSGINIQTELEFWIQNKEHANWKIL
tara:strand:+ start:155 stop:295 length:141 start_codon:yes stop_codon:yes gene_type:complete